MPFSSLSIKKKISFKRNEIGTFFEEIGPHMYDILRRESEIKYKTPNWFVSFLPRDSRIRLEKPIAPIPNGN